MPRPLFATDLDGTLLRSDDTVSDRTLAAVARANETAGFVFATGRPLRWIKAISELVGHRGWVVASNGGAVIDLATDTYLRTSLLDPDDLGHIVADLRAAIPGITCAFDRPGDRFAHDPEYLPRWTPPPGATEIARVETLLDTKVVKLLVRLESAVDGDTILEQVRSVVGGRASATRSLGTLVEITSKEATKGQAMAWVAEQRGIGAADVVAFGDMPNDVDMLVWAGHGVAVANAHPSVLDIANEVTASNNDDGVALVMERFLA